MEKQPFEIEVALARIHEAIRPFRKAALFELAEQGDGTAFEPQMACMISTRTFDEVSIPCALRLFGSRRHRGVLLRHHCLRSAAPLPCHVHEERVYLTLTQDLEVSIRLVHQENRSGVSGQVRSTIRIATGLGDTLQGRAAWLEIWGEVRLEVWLEASSCTTATASRSKPPEDPSHQRLEP